MKYIAYLIMRRAIMSELGNDYNKFAWAGALNEFLWVNPDNPIQIMLSYGLWFAFTIFGAVKLGFVGFCLGLSSFVPMIAVWEFVSRLIAKWAIEYYNEH